MPDSPRGRGRPIAAAAAPAQGASRLVVRGAGFGHGVGMSQYGAYGFAQRGRDQAFILGHYYTGTSSAGSTRRRGARAAARRRPYSFTGAARVGGGRSWTPRRRTT